MSTSIVTSTGNDSVETSGNADQASNASKYLPLDQAPICVAAHTFNPLLLTGYADGALLLTDLTQFISKDVHELPTNEKYKGGNSCAVAEFIDCSTFIVGTRDGELFVFDTNSNTPLEIKSLLDGEEGASAVPTELRGIDNNNFLVGDDNGGVHLFDSRVNSKRAQQSSKTCSKPQTSCLQQADYISAIHKVSAFNKEAFLVTSGDGTLCAYDVRFAPNARIRLQYGFDSFQEDLLSLAVLPKHCIAVAGTLTGPLNLYNMRFMDESFDPDSGGHVDRLYGHPEAVNVVMEWKEDRDVILSASSDGIIRIIDIPQRKLVGILDYPEHETKVANESLELLRRGRKKKKNRAKERWPIEDMLQVGGLEKPFFALLGHGCGIQLCDGSALLTSVDESEEGKEDESGDVEERKTESSSEQEAEQRRTSRKKKRRRKGFEKKAKNEGRSSFFEGL